MDGIVKLIASHLYPVALLAFVASLMVPALKLAGLAVMLMVVMLVTTGRGASCLLKERAKLYYIVARIGRWSIVDIIMGIAAGRAGGIWRGGQHRARHGRTTP